MLHPQCGFNAGPVYYVQTQTNSGLVAVREQFVYTVLERWYCFCFLELLRKRIVLESSLKTEAFLSSSVDGLGRWRLSLSTSCYFSATVFRVL